MVEVFMIWVDWMHSLMKIEVADEARIAGTVPSPEHACALMKLLFLVSIAVLEDYEYRFGITGRMCLKYFDAFHHSGCPCVPDASLRRTSCGDYEVRWWKKVVWSEERDPNNAWNVMWGRSRFGCRIHGATGLGQYGSATTPSVSRGELSRCTIG
ncbi:uncharacterized protein PITG_04161 [Phytophthora infestans T30-4]|uniref:Uncharacterized protein n=1 Tax=Phytophthora infestans (strain T30-4) TaxID=403677 RepID=D0N0P6_PHYIT|nr:uncharacterized protein PITG_04161 [Phytophthora infestans T30-4]EEY67209.1 hypothetical protein PITG_04161 [Phytophthora infestans T30-4]|eukprot:XP_002905857.1 hypothetical protein PITG_04161 [Phytophthora infestans T30-4]